MNITQKTQELIEGNITMTDRFMLISRRDAFKKILDLMQTDSVNYDIDLNDILEENIKLIDEVLK